MHNFRLYFKIYLMFFSYSFITAAFSVIVVISNVISAKLFLLPLFDNFAIPAGLITYPLTFFLSDLMTELYGKDQAKLMIRTALLLSVLCLGIIEIALILPASHQEIQASFESVLGVNGWIVFGSLTAFIIAQSLDVYLYALIKRWTGEPHLWLRNNGSTLLSQIVDTAAVNWIYLYFGLGMGHEAIAQIALFSYAYKALFSVALTPVFYLFVSLGKRHKPSYVA